LMRRPRGIADLFRKRIKLRIAAARHEGSLLSLAAAGNEKFVPCPNIFEQAAFGASTNPYAAFVETRASEGRSG